MPKSLENNPCVRCLTIHEVCPKAHQRYYYNAVCRIVEMGMFRFSKMGNLIEKDKLL